MIRKQTYIYKIVGNCTIRADVYRISDGVIRPAIIFIHGGALIGGGRNKENPIIIDMLANAGYVVVSIDYRLAPETKLNGIIEDIRDALNWVHQEGPSMFNIDSNRIGVVGNSAGGYLTLMSGFVADYHPKALVSIYGYGDIDGDWYSNPDPFYCQQPLISESTARTAVGTKAISETVPSKQRFVFYIYCRQRGIWAKEVTGHDPKIEPKVFDQFCPIRNITSLYPPTILLHGDMDTDVPYEQSAAMAKKLEEVGVEHQLVTLLGKGHGFEATGFADQVVADALNKALAFLKQHL